ncbi:ribosomal protein L36e-domain-containing protein [Aspergillus karnatakaensis]|uniref:ribosomal protein L36e-domain-containing protein n=1 Tax=Aspergillus karnatakaensis TaxID=1810916 RepID=UPI003CCCE4C9
MTTDTWALPRVAAGQRLIARSYDYRDSVRTWDIVTQTVCLAVSSLCVGMRMYTKGLVIRTPGWDDSYAVVTFEADKHGNGTHQDTVAPSDLREFAKLANASQIVYAPLIFLTKLSIFLLYLRVFAPSHKGRTYWVIQLLIGFNLAFYLANFFLKIFQCTPRSKIWDPATPGHCININIVILITAAINVASDLMMLCVPIVCVWRLQMSKRKKLGISTIFAAGIFGCFASIMRLEVSVRHRNTTDKTYDWYSEFLWTAAEITCGIIASCLPALPTFMRHFFSKARSIISGISRTRRSSSQGRSWEKPTEAYVLSRGRKRRLAHDLFNTEASGDDACELDDERTQIFSGPSYATSEARAEGSRTPVEGILNGEATGGDGGRQVRAGAILKIVEVDVDPDYPVEMAQERSGIAVGLNKGHKTTALNTPKTRISRSKGKASRRTAFVRDIAREVVGLAPYERRVIELLRNAQDKRARKLAKKRLGTFTRGKRKVEDMQRVIAEARRVGAH